MINTKNLIIIVSVFGTVVLLGAGCAKQSSGDKNQLGKRGDNATSTERGFKIDGTKTTAADLVIGKKVMVMGTANADGTITATQILLGDFASRPGFSSGTFSSSTARRVFNQDQPRAAGNSSRQGRDNNESGARSDRPQMQGNRGMGRVIGEILKKDDASVVLKAQDGGSKIIFYSDKTEILIIAPPAAPPPGALAPAAEKK